MKRTEETTRRQGWGLPVQCPVFLKVAYRKMPLGASLVQIYTALIYDGAGPVKRINRGLCELLVRDGVRHVNEAVGTEA